MKKLLLVSACLWALVAQPVRAHAAEPDVVVVKVLESRLATHIMIVRSWGIPEELNITPSITGNETTVALDMAKEIQKVLAKLYAQGYAITSTFSGERGTSTLVLVKAH